MTRRRTLVWIVPEAVHRAHSRVISTADAAIGRALGNRIGGELAEVIEALDLVAERLRPLAGTQAGTQATREAS